MRFTFEGCAIFSKKAKITKSAPQTLKIAWSDSFLYQNAWN